MHAPLRRDAMPPIISNANTLDKVLLRGAVQGQKVWEHDFEITSEPNRPQRGPTFWSGLGAQKIEIGNLVP